MMISLIATAALLLGSSSQEEVAPRPASLLARPLYLEEERPPLRALRNIVLLHSGVSKETVSHDSQRTPEEARALAEELARRLRAGEDFGALALEYSASFNARKGGALGAYPQGMLLPGMDRFLWTSKIGEVSDPVETPFGIQVLQREEAYSAVLHIRVHGEGAAQKIQSLRARLVAGEDFGDLAREHSMDKGSAESGGQYAIYIRGPQDTQLKALAFQLQEEELSEPFQSPLGWHLLKRVPRESLPRELEERAFVRARGLIVAWKGCLGASKEVTRDKGRAQELVLDMQKRCQEGETLAFFAASRFNDDPGGRDRLGDLGWIYRRNPDLPVFMSELFRVAPGTLLDLKETSAGYILVQREE